MSKKRSNKNLKAVQRDLEKFVIPVKQKNHVTSSSKVVGQVMETNQYGLFKFIKGNREIKTNKALESSIKEFGILQPIKVDKNFNIIEGQHRYTYAKKNTLPIKYIVSDEEEIYRIGEISELNNTSRKWSTNDYIHSYVEQGYVEYIKLKNLIRDTKDINTPITSISSLAMGARFGTPKTANIIDGSFSFYNYEGMIAFIEDYRKFLRQTGMVTNREVMVSVFAMYTVKNFDMQRLINKVNTTGKSERLVGIKQKSVITEHLVDAYNHRLATDSTLFLSYRISDNPKTRGQMILTGEVSDELVKLTD